MPKYIPPKRKEEEEPKYPIDPAKRIKQTRQNTFHRCQRQINLLGNEVKITEGDRRELFRKNLEEQFYELRKIKEE